MLVLFYKIIAFELRLFTQFKEVKIKTKHCTCYCQLTNTFLNQNYHIIFQRKFKIENINFRFANFKIFILSLGKLKFKKKQ